MLHTFIYIHTHMDLWLLALQGMVVGRGGEGDEGGVLQMKRIEIITFSRTLWVISNVFYCDNPNRLKVMLQCEMLQKQKFRSLKMHNSALPPLTLKLLSTSQTHQLIYVPQHNLSQRQILGVSYMQSPSTPQ